MPEQPRILVLTLYSGENEVEACTRSLHAQTYAAWDHRVLAHLANRQAHDTLYHTIMTSQGDYDLFLKLDADMVLAHDRALGQLVAPFIDNPDLDHLVVAVSDFLSRSPMIGAHVFSSRVRWPAHGDDLYVDPDPDFPGTKLILRRPRPEVILHAPDPGPLQAFRFGVHRALKATQAHRSLRHKKPFSATIQRRVLARVWRHFADTGDRRVGLAVLGADLIYNRNLPPTASDAGDDAVQNAFERHADLDAGELRWLLAPRWGSRLRRTASWVRVAGPLMTILVVLRMLRDALARVVMWATGNRPGLRGRP